MRLISQDGTIDVPYDNTIIYRNDEYIICVFGCTDKERVLARYSTDEKAKKAMEMLRNEYMQYETAKSEDYWFAFDYPKVFQFPADEDVEV